MSEHGAAASQQTSKWSSSLHSLGNQAIQATERKDVSVPWQAAVSSRKRWHTASSRNPCKHSPSNWCKAVNLFVIGLWHKTCAVGPQKSLRDRNFKSPKPFVAFVIPLYGMGCTSVPQPCFHVQTPNVAVMKPWEQLSPRSHRMASWQQILSAPAKAAHWVLQSEKHDLWL